MVKPETTTLEAVEAVEAVESIESPQTEQSAVSSLSEFDSGEKSAHSVESRKEASPDIEASDKASFHTVSRHMEYRESPADRLVRLYDDSD